MLVMQSARMPAAIRHALVDVVPDGSDEFLFVSAYCTRAGSLILIDSIRRKFGSAAYAALRKRVVFSLDFGLTEPEALELWAAQDNAKVYVAGVEGLRAGSLVGPTAFHPKSYLIGSVTQRFGGVIGSANMTSRGLTINTEAAWSDADLPPNTADVLFDAIEPDILALTSDLLEEYKQCRATLSPSAEAEEAAGVPEPPPINNRSMPVFWDAVSTGHIAPATFGQLWVQIDRAEGGSGNQVELPRGANRFFGAEFEDYDAGVVSPIITPYLVAGGKGWNDRTLRWHGDNRMERFNLPTLAQGGFEYAGSALLFRRLSDGGFEFIVAPWDSDLARSWRSASQRAGLIFKVGQSSARLAGLI